MRHLAKENRSNVRDLEAWLKVEPRQVERLGVPCSNLGSKTKRYLVKDILAWLDSRRATMSASWRP